VNAKRGNQQKARPAGVGGTGFFRKWDAPESDSDPPRRMGAVMVVEMGEARHEEQE